MYDTPLTTEQILTQLATTPMQIDELTQNVSRHVLTISPAPGEWSTRDILAHLRSCSDMWGGYILKILNEDRPIYKAVNPTTWIKNTNYRELDFHLLLQAYAAQRAELLPHLKVLREEDWLREALVTGAGKPRIRTIHTYGLWLGNHERSHLRQMAKTINTVRELHQPLKPRGIRSAGLG